MWEETPRSREKAACLGFQELTMLFGTLGLGFRRVQSMTKHTIATFTSSAQKFDMYKKITQTLKLYLKEIKDLVKSLVINEWVCGSTSFNHMAAMCVPRESVHMHM